MSVKASLTLDLIFKITSVNKSEREIFDSVKAALERLIITAEREGLLNPEDKDLLLESYYYQIITERPIPDSPPDSQAH